MNRASYDSASFRRRRSTAIDPGEPVADELVIELRRRWNQGDHCRAEVLLGSNPDLSPAFPIVIDLLYEEYCQRCAIGDEDAERDIIQRFPHLSGPLKVMLDCHRRFLFTEGEPPQFPQVGECIGDFCLTSELARGSRGRIFLATQATLADRQVVLKITPLDGAEHVALARLQHTHIVPLHSVLDDPTRDIRILCMPYFGSATLASVLQSFAMRPWDSWTGHDILHAIDTPVPGASLQAPIVQSAARQMLANISYVDAVCWMMACLADALQFAHERGVVHLDLKPSNVLIANDGQPMLLDFHLAREPIRCNGDLPDNFGGTLIYMPPEQQLAMRSLQDGRAIEQPVDCRADLFALGAMMYELFGGKLPMTADSPPLTQVNPNISVSLSDVVAKLTATEPGARFQCAGELAEDLRRFLTDQPLAIAPNRSWIERWQKWRRRKPSAVRAAGVLALMIVGAALLVTTIRANIRDRHNAAEQLLRDAQAQLNAGKSPGDVEQMLERALGFIEGRAFESELRTQLLGQLAHAKRLGLAGEIHTLADEIRVLYAVETLPPARAVALATRCASFWSRRDAIVKTLSSVPSLSVRNDLLDIAIFATRLEAQRAGEPSHFLDEVERMYGRNEVIDYERKALGIATGEVSSRVSESTDAWDHYALARAMLAAGETELAASRIASALRLDPSGRWTNYYAGLCAHRAGRYEEAIAAFSVCIGIAPRTSAHFYNRALAYAALNRLSSALADYDRVLELDPSSADALLNRGVLHLREKRFDNAIRDLELSLKHGTDGATAHYNLALVHVALNDPVAAGIQLDEVLRQDATHSAARALRNELTTPVTQPVPAR